VNRKKDQRGINRAKTPASRNSEQSVKVERSNNSRRKKKKAPVPHIDNIACVAGRVGSGAFTEDYKQNTCSVKATAQNTSQKSISSQGKKNCLEPSRLITFNDLARQEQNLTAAKTMNSLGKRDGKKGRTSEFQTTSPILDPAQPEKPSSRPSNGPSLLFEAAAP